MLPDSRCASSRCFSAASSCPRSSLAPCFSSPPTWWPRPLCWLPLSPAEGSDDAGIVQELKHHREHLLLGWGHPKAPGRCQRLNPLRRVQGRSFPCPCPHLRTRGMAGREGSKERECGCGKSLPELELRHCRLCEGGVFPPRGWGLLGGHVAP